MKRLFNKYFPVFLILGGILLLITIYIFKFTEPSVNHSDYSFLEEEIPDYSFLEEEIPDYSFLEEEIPDYSFLEEEIPDYSFLEEEIPDYSDYADNNIDDTTTRTIKRNHYFYFGFIAAIMIVYGLFLLVRKYFRKKFDKLN